MLFIKGLILGFLVAAPVGPIGLLCVRRTLSQGRLHGFLTGLGAATADAAYGAVAALGLTAISSFLLGNEGTLKLIGGIFLILLGLRIALSKSEQGQNINSVRAPLLKTYTSSLLLTITNPATILSFAAAFAGLGLAKGNGNGLLDAILMVLGVFLGSAAWWLALSGVTGLIRRRLDADKLRFVNIASGVTIVGFGLVALLSLPQPPSSEPLPAGAESAIISPRNQGGPVNATKKPDRRDSRRHR